MSRMVVFGVPSPPQSWVRWHSILVLNISLQPISGIQQKLKLAPMVKHATVEILEKLTTWKALRLLLLAEARATEISVTKCS